VKKWPYPYLLTGNKMRANSIRKKRSINQTPTGRSTK
jgi:hypothetical protein